MKTWLVAPVALSISIGAAPAARADGASDYLSGLDAAHIAYSNPATALDIGNSICQQLHRNAAPDVAAQAALRAGYEPGQAGKILFFASHALCPDTAAAVDRWGDSP
ncbi:MULTISPECIES: DUF732 domain-containing protein [unclassified Mycobacterium]|uniref:DUF732 domain-containing protein n=1 Tax=unclassified Mycobacterium TaxID=2642494 RepID=UPI0007FF5994|nr:MULTISPECIES: DUF732 domain-containing protein [unclassified Mycobacterium]OBG76186.1 hypothetical protein A5700_22865 [Mycobacterium sp. E1214]OBH28409.1 hypothetical protein A5693_22015 [Mycobacterium sp. E1319]